MAMSMASSSSFAALKKYDVFISFRGEDTRSGFTSHLHAALCRNYIETYIDYRIQKGDQVWAELLKAIKESTLFLVIFSKNYASSTWCLNELVEIMECHKNGQGVVVIPVKQTGSYGTALAKHKKQGNNDDKKMQNWKNALFEAANLSGFHFTTDRTESDLIEDIIRVVLGKLNHQYTNEVTSNFILDENYWSIQSSIKLDSADVQVIGLWGMGGIGKTTLATALYNKVSFQYEGRCFLENVKEVSKSLGINRTFNKLLSKLLREDLDIDTPKVIPPMIRRRLKRMKSFIVLDDVHTSELLQNMIGVGHGLIGAGSTVIVTTRDSIVVTFLIDCILLQNLPNLEIIDLTGSKKLIECPNVSGSPNLKHVKLEDCKSMSEVDSSIFHLQKLEGLLVTGCKSLKSLSSNTCSPALRHLYALNCYNLKEFSVPFASVDGLDLGLSEWDQNELPSSLLHTKNLNRFLFPLSDCLVNLPENFSNEIWLLGQGNCEQDPFITLDKVLSSPAFMSLKKLFFAGIPNLFEIPDSISLLSSLETLELTDMAIRSLPETIKYLPQLNRVDIYECKLLQSIPALPQIIEKLVVWNCQSLEKMLSSTGEAYDKPNCFLFMVLLNCKKLDPHSYQTLLKVGRNSIEIIAELISIQGWNPERVIWNLLPTMPGMEKWFHYSSTQVSMTLELPSNLLGFAYYLILSQGHMESDVDFGCECYFDNSSGERVCITSVTRGGFEVLGKETSSFYMMADHMVLWYDPVICKQIIDAVELTKANNDMNPKLTFTFFIDKTLYDEVAIKKCGFHWIIYQKDSLHDEEETASLSDFESHDEEETSSSSDFQSNDQEDGSKIISYLWYSLKELMHIGFGVEHMNALFGSTEGKSNG
nr:nodulation protein [Melilotus officinalis]